jgi:hypothetical protein
MMIIMLEMARLYATRRKSVSALDERADGEDSGSGRQGGPGYPVLVSGRVRSLLARRSCWSTPPGIGSELDLPSFSAPRSPS